MICNSCENEIGTRDIVCGECENVYCRKCVIKCTICEKWYCEDCIVITDDMDMCENCSDNYNDELRHGSRIEQSERDYYTKENLGL